MYEVHTNEEVSEVININMGALQRRPYWRCAAVVFDTDEKGSPLWCWAISFSFPFFDIAGRILIRSTSPPGPER
jgi:hypothetical protein